MFHSSIFSHQNIFEWTVQQVRFQETECYAFLPNTGSHKCNSVMYLHVNINILLVADLTSKIN
jgi:hypothetical protein